MKKVILLSLLILGACGKEKVQLFTEQEKTEQIKKIISGDKNTEKELFKIKEKLKEQMAKGNLEAKEELDEWERKEKYYYNNEKTPQRESFKFKYAE
ncbi:hypothetical protein [Cetobacterium sp.]|uniref:hypothetical protein n=1 Tax=Cetobacterium sp. TaxID=2071632 RepID=UPI003F33545F